MSNKKFRKFFSLLGSSIGVVASLVGIFALPRYLLGPALVMLIATALVLGIVFLRKRNSSHGHLLKLFDFYSRKQPASVHIDFAKHKGHIYELYEVEKFEYGQNEIISYSGLLQWWKCFPEGVHILTMDDEVKGGIGLWPITEDTYVDITNGKLDEADIGCTNLVCGHSQDLKARRYWYFADIIISPELRRRKALYGFHLLNYVLTTWTQEIIVSEDTVSVCAITYTDEGRKLARKLGFSQCSKLRDGDVFVIVASKASIQAKQRLLFSDLPSLNSV